MSVFSMLICHRSLSSVAFLTTLRLARLMTTAGKRRRGRRFAQALATTQEKTASDARAVDQLRRAQMQLQRDRGGLCDTTKKRLRGAW
jgi:hypothetical protein